MGMAFNQVKAGMTLMSSSYEDYPEEGTKYQIYFVNEADGKNVMCHVWHLHLIRSSSPFFLFDGKDEKFNSMSTIFGGCTPVGDISEPRKRKLLAAIIESKFANI